MKAFSRLIDIILISVISIMGTLLFLNYQKEDNTKTIEKKIETPLKPYQTNELSAHIRNISKEKEKSILWIDSDTKNDSFGTGFVIKHKGKKYVLTNYHVIDGKKSIEGYTIDKKAVPLKVVGVDNSLDLAVLSFEKTTNIPSLEFSSSNSVQIGDFVVAIGHPLGLEYTTTFGIVSAKERQLSLGSKSFNHLIQTDAAINPGNSGGPLFNLNGEVIGINTAIMEDSQGLGFAVPSSEITKVLDELIVNGAVKRPFFGVNVSETEQGLEVVSTYADSPAEKIGLREKDVILGINNEEIKTADDLTKSINSQKVGRKIKVKFKRNNNIIVKEALLENKEEILQK